jgi:hypothetical protein
MQQALMRTLVDINHWVLRAEPCDVPAEVTVADLQQAMQFAREYGRLPAIVKVMFKRCANYYQHDQCIGVSEHDLFDWFRHSHIGTKYDDKLLARACFET